MDRGIIERSQQKGGGVSRFTQGFSVDQNLLAGHVNPFGSKRESYKV